MAPSTRTLIIAAAAAATTVVAQSSFTPLASKHFTYTALPYQADTDDGERGRQFGYNICNSTTEGQTSRCQTAMINSIDDFCLWGPPEPNSLIGNTEGEAVAWCTKPGRGTRQIPADALTGVQFMKTSAYVQVVGFIKQELINIAADDYGGEMDPHGADQRGNPLGGLLFSNQFQSGQEFTQAVEWHNFMGAGVFCLKACDPAGPDAARYCEHIFDRIGCERNAPASYATIDGTFESCEGENQDFPGVYTGSDGRVSTYTQPPESLGEITFIPYTARVPASSNCQPFQSAALYGNAPTVSAPAPTGSSSAPSGSATGPSRSSGSASRTTGGSSTRSTNSASASTTPGAAVAGAVVPRGALAGVAAVAAGILGAAVFL